MESKMKYTKGPWIINYHRGAQNCFRLDNEQSASEFIAEHEGNKALITAAPELLEALKGIHSLLESGYLVRNIDDDAKPDFALRQIEPVKKLKAMVDAIAKAEGDPHVARRK